MKLVSVVGPTVDATRMNDVGVWVVCEQQPKDGPPRKKFMRIPCVEGKTEQTIPGFTDEPDITQFDAWIPVIVPGVQGQYRCPNVACAPHAGVAGDDQ